MRIRKTLITGLAATVATIALGSIATAANANVSYDDTRVGHVDKGDVMRLFGWNESKFQNQYVKTVEFTNKLVATTDTSWGCSDGSIQHHYRITTSVRPLAVNQVFNTSSSKVTGWTLNGLSTTDYGTVTEGPTLAARGSRRSLAPLARMRTSPSTRSRRATRTTCRSPLRAARSTCP